MKKVLTLLLLGSLATPVLAGAILVGRYFGPRVRTGDGRQ